MSSYNNTTSASNSDTKTEELNIFSLVHIILGVLIAVHLIYFIYMLIYQNCCKKVKTAEESGDGRRKINENCSICLEDLNNEVQLMCSHSFCANCIIAYGKQRFGMHQIACPICRQESKFLFAQFEKTTDNLEAYNQIVDYNHDSSGQYKTSYILIVDACRMSFYYLRQLANTNNPRFARHRAFLILILLISFIFIILPMNWSSSDTLSIIEDLLYYLFLIIYLGARFTRNFRRETNEEFERIHSQQDIQLEEQNEAEVIENDPNSINNQV